MPANKSGFESRSSAENMSGVTMTFYETTPSQSWQGRLRKRHRSLMHLKIEEFPSAGLRSRVLPSCQP